MRYKLNDKCTSWVAADLINMSEHTGRRWLRKLRLAKKYKPQEPVSVGEFLAFFHWSSKLVDI